MEPKPNGEQHHPQFSPVVESVYAKLRLLEDSRTSGSFEKLTTKQRQEVGEIEKLKTIAEERSRDFSKALYTNTTDEFFQKIGKEVADPEERLFTYYHIIPDIPVNQLQHFLTIYQQIPDVIQTKSFGRSVLKGIKMEKVSKGVREFFGNSEVTECLYILTSGEPFLNEELKKEVSLIVNEKKGVDLYQLMSKSKFSLSLKEIFEQLNLSSYIGEEVINKLAKGKEIDDLTLPVLLAKLSREDNLSQLTREQLQGIVLGFIELSMLNRSESNYAGKTEAAVNALINFNNPQKVNFLKYVRNQYDQNPIKKEVERIYSGYIKRGVLDHRTVLDQALSFPE